MVDLLNSPKPMGATQTTRKIFVLPTVFTNEPTYILR